MSFILPVTSTGASGQVQDLQGHHQDDQEQLLDHFQAVFKGVLGGVQGGFRGFRVLLKFS